MAGCISYFKSWVAGIKKGIPSNIATSLGLAKQFTMIRIAGEKLTLTNYLGEKLLKTSDFSVETAKEINKKLRGPQVLIIPNNDSVSITLTVPKTAHRSLDQLLESEIERMTPFRFSEVKTYSEVISYEAGQINLIIHVVPIIKFESLLARAEKWGLKPETAVVQVEENSNEFAGSFVINDSNRRNSNIFQHAAIIGLIFLGLSSVASPFVQREWKIAKLRDISSEMSPKIETILSKQRLLDQLQQEFEFISSFAKESQNTILLLDHITSTLPDTAWLTQYSVKNNELILHGFATNASDVLAALAALEIIKKPLFKSPIMREPEKDIERFHITAKLKM